MKKIIWAPSVATDLREIYDYISLDSPWEAAKLRESIILSAEKLARFPNLGRMIPEIGEFRYRELIIGEYRLMHEIRHGEVLIFRVLHSKRLFSAG